MNFRELVENVMSQNINISASDGGGGVGGEDGDSFNSVTCFCGKPFAGRPMIECSSCLTWLHMSCAKVKRKNIPEFYYCDGCKSNGSMLSPTSNVNQASTSSGEECAPNLRNVNNSQNGNNTLSSNFNITDGLFNNQNLSASSTKPKKPKLMKKNSSLMMSSSDNIKNNASDSKYLVTSKKSSNVNGKLKKMRQKLSPTTKKMRQQAASPTKTTKAYASSSLAAAASLTELSLNHQVSTITNGNSSAENISSNLLKSPIATNNNNIYNVIETQSIVETENGDKYNKRLKLL